MAPTPSSPLPTTTHDPGAHGVAVEPLPVDALASTRAVVDRELSTARSPSAFGLGARGLWLLSGTLVGALLALIVLGGRYYLLPIEQRPFHDWHPWLRPSGWIGLSTGLVGSLLIAATFAYVVRKQTVRTASALRSLPRWMHYHVLAGLVGSLLITVHSGLMLTSVLGTLGFLALWVTVLSGLAGRYLMRSLPPGMDEEAARPEAIRERLLVYEQKLIHLGLDSERLRSDEQPLAQERPWLITAIVRVLVGDAEARRQRRRLEQAVAEQPELADEAASVLELVRRLCVERQLWVRYHELRKLVGTWRFLHRWLAIVLALAIVFHVWIALRYADLWILGGAR